MKVHGVTSTRDIRGCNGVCKAGDLENEDIRCSYIVVILYSVFRINQNLETHQGHVPVKYAWESICGGNALNRLSKAL
jgi:hypothetical protein